MKINIGENIKTLRKLNNITQEKLAEYLGVTYQTVSKWENGTSLPSIALLPSIANVFNVSIDELYDLEQRTNDAKVSEYERNYAALCTQGDNIGRVELMRRALNEYPRNYSFMNYLARSLYRCEKIDICSDEIISLCERILEECKIDTIRFSALQTIARVYNEIGQTDKAIEYANEMPTMASSKEFFMSEMLTGEAKARQLQENIFFLTFNAGKMITYLLGTTRGIGKEFTPEERIQLYEAANTLYKTIAYDGNYLVLNGKFYWHYAWIAVNYCNIGKYDEAMKHLLEAEKYAYDFDEFVKCGKKQNYTSKLLDRVIIYPDRLLKHWSGTNSQKLAEMLEWNGFSPLFGREDFIALRKRLLEKE